MRGAVGLAQRIPVGLMEDRFGIGEAVDHLLADCRGGGAFDVGAAEVAEELLILSFDPLPRGLPRTQENPPFHPVVGSALPSSGTVKMAGNSRS